MMRVNGSELGLVLGLVLVLALMYVSPAVTAYETDPYTNRHVPIADSTELLDARVNAALTEIAANWKRGADEAAFVRAVYWKLGGVHWVDRFERWAINSEHIEKLENSRSTSVYKGVPLYAIRVAGIFGFGPTVKVAGVYVGTDKFGHFFSQGRKFYERYVRMGDEGKAAARSAYTEAAIFGQLTTGIYSNADVVANFEGYRFYRSLFNTNPDLDKAPIFEWRDGRPLRQRTFTWSDHVNDFWDEAINANYYDNRYWVMWKLPMYGCNSADEVLAEVKACVKAFPDCYVRCAGFDNIKQVQCHSFLVYRPKSGAAREVADRQV